jgi:hypothetical protein
MVNPVKVDTDSGPLYTASLPFMHKGERFYITVTYAPDVDDVDSVIRAEGPGITGESRDEINRKLYNMAVSFAKPVKK